jgi:hypothetical protein
MGIYYIIEPVAGGGVALPIADAIAWFVLREEWSH